MAQNPVVTITMEDGSVMKAELYPEIAPESVNNFISLIQKKFYDGLIFHRVISGFMIQGGDPEGLGFGGPGYHIKGEFKINGFENNLKHTAGVLSMARAQDPDSAGSQFFIMHKDSPFLDGQYAAFGKLIEGMDVVNAIAAVQDILFLLFTYETDMTNTQSGQFIRNGIETKPAASLTPFDFKCIAQVDEHILPLVVCGCLKVEPDLVASHDG